MLNHQQEPEAILYEKPSLFGSFWAMPKRTPGAAVLYLYGHRAYWSDWVRFFNQFEKGRYKSAKAVLWLKLRAADRALQLALSS